ncbi:MAG: hypothetical protein HOP25_00400 [Methylotenera sp.]|nr:hypothetical protein [Methylotenera sp.]
MSSRVRYFIKPPYNSEAAVEESPYQEYSALGVSPKRITLNKKTIELDYKNFYSESLSRALFLGISSEWLNSLSEKSKFVINKESLKFLEWLKFQDLTIENKYLVLKDYESFRVSIEGLKPQSSGVNVLINILRNSMGSKHLDLNSLRYISLLIKQTKISAIEPRNIETVSSFFSSMPWLREEIGNENYLKLESPKRLIDSFSISIASTLLFILKTKSKAGINVDTLKQLEPVSTQGNRDKYQKYCQNIISNFGTTPLNIGDLDDLTELILLDCLPTDRRVEYLDKWVKYGCCKSISNKTKRGLQCFTSPMIFSSSLWPWPTSIEKHLCSWICASLKIQPADILKLKRNDFVITKNQNGRPLSLQIIYYKGRSGVFHESPLLDAGLIEAQALIEYINHIPSGNSKLFDNHTPNISLSFNTYCIFGRISRIINSPNVKEYILKNLSSRNCSSVFLNAFIGMTNSELVTFDKWSHQQKSLGLEYSASCYRKTIIKHFPLHFIGLAFIKNSAVHASSDRYRDGDLVNYSSHNSDSEKISYLTDSNKDWVNQHGRITRLVLQDIEKYVYKPNLDIAIERTQDLILRTKIIKSINGLSNLNKININSIGLLEDDSRFDYKKNDPDVLLVLDSPETIVNMFHYIEEAQRQKSRLIAHSLTFFEMTVLPTAEWMQTLIQNKFRLDSIKEARSTYELIKKNLPKLFENELNAGVSP